MSAQPPIAARHKGFNRAEIVDQNFTEFVQNWHGERSAAAARRRAGAAGQHAGCARFSRAVRVAVDLAASGPDGARAARQEQGVLHHRLERSRGQRHGGAADAAHRSGVPALPLRRVHGRALPQAAAAMEPARSGDGLGAELCRQQGRSGLRRAPQGVGQQAAVGAAADLDHRQRTCPRRWARRSRSSRRGASGTRCRSPRTASRSARSAMPRATTPARRPRSTPPRGRPTRSCRRRCCSCARTTASASR